MLPSTYTALRYRKIRVSPKIRVLLYGTHTHPFNGPFFRDYPGEPVPENKTNLDFTEARDSEWQWHQLSHMQVCTSLQTDNHASTSPLSFLQAGCASCRPINSVKALKANFSMELCPKLWTWKISPWQVDRVVNETRRQSSLLTTPTTVDVS